MSDVLTFLYALWYLALVFFGFHEGGTITVWLHWHEWHHVAVVQTPYALPVLYLDGERTP
jgi:hypothetical protein